MLSRAAQLTTQLSRSKIQLLPNINLLAHLQLAPGSDAAPCCATQAVLATINLRFTLSGCYSSWGQGRLNG